MDDGAHRRVEDLTERQREVLEMLANGLTNHEIATRLGITLDGAKYHVREIMARLEVDSRDAAVAAWRGEKRPTRRLRRRIAQAVANLGPWWAGAVVAGGSIAALAAVFVLVAINSDGNQAGEPAVSDSSTATASATTDNAETNGSQPYSAWRFGRDAAAGPTPDPAFPPEWRGYAQERWTFKGTPGDYALVAADESGVVAGMAPADPFELGPAMVVSLDPDTGAEQWRQSIDCHPLVPALSEDAAFVPCLDGTMIALSRADGSEVWRTNTGTAPYAPVAAGGLVITDSSSPDEDQYTLMHEPDVYGVGDVVALDEATGQERWRFAHPEASSFISVVEDRVYVSSRRRGGATGRTGLTVLELATGTVIWSAPGVGEMRQRPMVVDGNVFVAGDGTWSMDAATGTLNWTNERSPYDIAVVEGMVVGLESYGSGAFFGLDATTGEEIWSDSFCDCSHTLGVHEGRAIITIYTGQVYEIDPKNGTPRWSNESDDGDIGYTPIVVGDQVFTGSKNSGTITAFDIP